MSRIVVPPPFAPSGASTGLSSRRWDDKTVALERARPGFGYCALCGLPKQLGGVAKKDQRRRLQLRRRSLNAGGSSRMSSS